MTGKGRCQLAARYAPELSFFFSFFIKYGKSRYSHVQPIYEHQREKTYPRGF